MDAPNKPNTEPKKEASKEAPAKPDAKAPAPVAEKAPEVSKPAVALNPIRKNSKPKEIIEQGKSLNEEFNAAQIKNLVDSKQAEYVT